MAGPSLRQLHAHHAIHQGGLSGAVAITEKMEELLREKAFEEARKEADNLIEYWETRILSHADAEEEGFYQEILEKNPSLKDNVGKLIHEHNLLRIIVKNIKKTFDEEGLTPEVLQQFHALLVVNSIHSQEEERILFGEGSR